MHCLLIAQNTAKRWLLGILSTLLSLMLVGICAEGIARYIVAERNLHPQALRQRVLQVSQLSQALFLPIRSVYGKLKPNAKVTVQSPDYQVEYQTNEYGHRDAGWSLKPEENKVRVLLLGDSFTFGEGVEYGSRFSEVIEKQLPVVEVLNTGLPGMGLDEMLFYYLAEGQRFEPQVVILVLNMAEIERDSSIVYTNQAKVSRSIGLDGSSVGQTVYIDPLQRNVPKQLPLVEHSTFMRLVDRWLLAKSLQQTSLDYGAELIRGVVKKKPEISSADEQKVKAKAIIEKLETLTAEQGQTFIVMSIEPFVSLSFVSENMSHAHYFEYAAQLSELSTRQELSFLIDPHFNTQTNQKLGEWMSVDLQKILSENN